MWKWNGLRNAADKCHRVMLDLDFCVSQKQPIELISAISFIVYSTSFL
jgi:hypothetical protein